MYLLRKEKDEILNEMFHSDCFKKLYGSIENERETLNSLLQVLNASPLH